MQILYFVLHYLLLFFTLHLVYIINYNTNSVKITTIKPSRVPKIIFFLLYFSTSFNISLKLIETIMPDTNKSIKLISKLDKNLYKNKYATTAPIVSAKPLIKV